MNSQHFVRTQQIAPDGTDVSSMAAVRRVMKTLPVEHFIFPLTAHALGTGLGAYIAARLSSSYRTYLALIIGGFFLVGGLAMILNCGGPTWFITIDLLLAYIPMSFCGSMFAKSKDRRHKPRL